MAALLRESVAGHPRLHDMSFARLHPDTHPWAKGLPRPKFTNDLGKKESVRVRGMLAAKCAAALIPKWTIDRRENDNVKFIREAMPSLGLYPCACFDITFSSIPWPDLAAGYNLTYGLMRGSQARKKQKCTWMQHLSKAQQARLNECAVDCGYEDGLASFADAFNRDPEGTIRGVPQRYKDLA